MSVEVVVAVEDDSALPRVDSERVERAVRHALAAERAEAVEISVALVGDARIERLNEEYLSHDGPTDVISFPMRAPDGGILGDVYIGLEQAARQAATLGVPLDEEVLRLAIHGTLHVLGHDHPEDADGRAESEMYRRQEELLGRFLSGDDAAG